MFTIYDKSLSIYQKNFLERTNLIMGLFSGDGGRFILYRAGQPPLEAETPPSLYRVAKSVGHFCYGNFRSVSTLHCQSFSGFNLAYQV